MIKWREMSELPEGHKEQVVVEQTNGLYTISSGTFRDTDEIALRKRWCYVSQITNLISLFTKIHEEVDKKLCTEAPAKSKD